MPRNIRNSRPVKRSTANTNLETRVSQSKASDLTLSDKLQMELKSNQSYLSLVLGLLIVLVVGILVFNYLKKTQPTVGPAQQSITEGTTPQPEDVTPQALPGKYTVKEGDTLFNIAEFYYKDGYQYPKIAETNKLDNVDQLAVGQVLDIPALPVAQTAKATDNNSQNNTLGTGTGGATNQTIWGDAITGDTYTVVDGDWLSKIAGRAYGDIMAFDKIAKANNISNPDVIEPGTVLKIPR